LKNTPKVVLASSIYRQHGKRHEVDIQATNQEIERTILSWVNIVRAKRTIQDTVRAPRVYQRVPKEITPTERVRKIMDTRGFICWTCIIYRCEMFKEVVRPSDRSVLLLGDDVVGQDCSGFYFSSDLGFSLFDYWRTVEDDRQSTSRTNDSDSS
ncbi:hypothetical protein KCU98_g275, partial [Aureobasidium melanogenum]